MEVAIQAAREEWIAEVRDKDPNSTEWGDALEDLNAMAEPLMLWKDQYPFDVPVLEVEQPYVFPFPGDSSIYIRMRPDRIGLRNAYLWHVQHKALAAGKDFSSFILLAHRSYHEHIYAEGIVQKYGLDSGPITWQGHEIKGYRGTHFDLYRKLKYRRKQTLKQLQAGEPGTILNPVQTLFWQQPMIVDLDSP